MRSEAYLRLTWAWIHAKREVSIPTGTGRHNTWLEVMSDGLGERLEGGQPG